MTMQGAKTYTLIRELTDGYCDNRYEYLGTFSLFDNAWRTAIENMKKMKQNSSWELSDSSWIIYTQNIDSIDTIETMYVPLPKDNGYDWRV